MSRLVIIVGSTRPGRAGQAVADWFIEQFAQLKTVVTALRMVPIVESVNIPFFTERIDDSGEFHPNEVTEHAADAVLDELARLDSALRPLRKARQQAA